jgi:hypothetical protein
MQVLQDQDFYLPINMDTMLILGFGIDEKQGFCTSQVRPRHGCPALMPPCCLRCAEFGKKEHPAALYRHVQASCGQKSKFMDISDEVAWNLAKGLARDLFSTVQITSPPRPLLSTVTSVSIRQSCQELLLAFPLKLPH